MRQFCLSLSFFLLLFVNLVFTANLIAQTSELKLNQPIERQIKGGETQTFQFNVKAGNYALTEVEQKNIDVVVSLFDADGKLIVEMDGKDGRLWREDVSCIAVTNSDYQIKIKAYGTNDQAGSYTIKPVENRKSEFIDQKRLEAERHLNAGRKLYQEGGDSLSNAVKEYESALALWQEIKDVEWEAVTLINLGWANQDLSKTDSALAAYTRALELFQIIKDRKGEIKSGNSVGNIYNYLAQYDNALKIYEQSLIISREIKYRRGESAVLNNLGLVYNNLGQYEKAVDFYEQSLIISREIKNQSLEVNTTNNLGNIYNHLRQYEKAKDYFEKSLIISREIKDRAGEGLAVFDLGFAHDNLGQYEKATEFYEQSLIISREIKDQSLEVKTLVNLGLIYDNLGEYEKAKDYDEQALIISREIKYRFGEGVILNNLGNVYDNLAGYEKAKEFYEQSLIISREIKDRTGEDFALMGLGNVHLHSEQYEKSKDYYEQSLIISREIKDRRIEGSTLSGLGNVYFYLEQYEKAKDYYEQSLTIRQETKNRTGEANTLANLGNVYNDLGQYEKAIDYYEQSLIIRREVKDHSGEGLDYWNLLISAERLGNHSLAIFYGKQAVNIFQEIRGNIKGLDKESQKSFLDSKTYIYRRLSNILISEGRFLEAQEVLDLVKNEEYKDISRAGEKSDTIPYSQSENEVVRKIDALTVLNREQTELRKQQKEQGEQFPADKLKRLEQLTVDIKTVNLELENALTALSNSETSVKDAVADIKSEKNLQSALQNLGKETNSGVVALYTVIGTEDEKDAGGQVLKDKTRSKFGWVILVTKDTRKAYPIDVTDLEQTVFQFRTALSSDKYDPRPLAEKLYNAIFRQTSEKQKVTLEQDLNEILGKYPNKTLMWSLDGVLRYIPMAALNDGKGYLVEKYRNVVFTKESLLWLMNQPKTNPLAIGLGVSAGNKELKMSELPGVEKELSDIIKQQNEKTGILNGTRKLNGQFKKSEILHLKDEDNNFQTVHIASHYSFNPTDQNSSYLLVGDGKLTFGEMKNEDNLFGTVDLLTLSACDTGVSGNGREAEGFAYLAQSLGAKSVIASLWQVSDVGTPELMIRFYKLRTEHPEIPKGEAFRQAQLSLLTGSSAEKLDAAKRAEIVGNDAKLNLPLFVKDAKKPLAHPYYWSSFVLIGNWK